MVIINKLIKVKAEKNNKTTLNMKTQISYTIQSNKILRKPKFNEIIYKFVKWQVYKIKLI